MRNSDDANLLVRFFRQMERNDLATAENGKPEFNEIECISIRVPGSRDEFVGIVTDEHKSRFKDEYRRWKDNEGAPVSGTPLAEWPAATTSFVDEMRLIGVRTVEELCGLSDGAVMMQAGLMTMRTRAQAWLRDNDAASSLAKAEGEKQALLDRIAALESQLSPAKPARRAAKPVEINPAELSDEELEAMTAPAA